MADLIGVRVEGATRLRNTLRAAGVDMKDLTRLNREAANIVLPVAKALTPVSPTRKRHVRTTLRAAATQKAGIIRAGNTAMPYAGVIHFGTSRGYTDSLGRTRAIQAQPWISLAAKQTEPDWVDNYFDGLMAVINTIQGD